MMNHRVLPTLTATLSLSLGLAFAIEFPTGQEGSEVTLFAQEPLIKHPIGICFDHRNRLLAVESHTHFPPEDYDGPKHDRILWLRDTDGDGKADDSIVFFEGLQNICLVKLHPTNGWIYVTTRNEVLRLRDTDGDGVANWVDRKLAWLETEGNHPHNGISGLAFDKRGRVFFGMGENLGVEYTLHGADGKSVSDEGEGGNIWWMRGDGSELRRFATGFWNPFGLAVDANGELFASDNDPSGSPPSRLHWVIDGGDYGYQYRYGRSGDHPFIAWNGELPGTIPMLAGTGEAPCDILAFGPKEKPRIWVTSWVDHRVELFESVAGVQSIRPQPNSNDPSGRQVDRTIPIRGGADFRPVGLDLAPNGDLFVSDWVKRSYQLHGFGRIWRVSKPAPPSSPHAAPFYQGESENALKPWHLTRLIEVQAEITPTLDQIEISELSAESKYITLLGSRRSNAQNRLEILPAALNDTNRIVRLLALKWIADEQLAEFRQQVTALLETETDPDLFLGALTALQRTEGGKVDDAAMAKLLKKHLFDPAKPEATRLAALRILPNPARNLKASELAKIIDENTTELSSHALRLLTQVDDPAKSKVLPQYIERDRFALVGLPDREIATEADPGRNRPPTMLGPGNSVPEVLGAWMEWLASSPNEPDPENGRFVFYHPKLGNCAICHRVDGIGRTGGPELSRVGEMSTQHLLISLLNPAAEVSPQFQPWLIETTDEKHHLAFQLGEKGGTHWYADIAGNEIELKIEEILHREQVEGSLMPPGLLGNLSDREIRDLIAFLENLRPDAPNDTQVEGE